MKKFFKILLILTLIIILVYVSNVTSIPDNLILMQGEELNIKTMFGLNLENSSGQTIEAMASDTEKISKEVGKLDLSLNLGNFSLKDVTVNVIPNTVVIPGGEAIGLRLYTSGVLVVGMSEIVGTDNKSYSPYKDSGLQEGDMIVKIDDKAITCTSDLITKVNECNGNSVEITYVRDGNNYITEIKPTKTEENEYKLGLWVRDAAAGVGTITYYDPESQMFGALGHGILDIDTDQLIDIAKGEVITSKILSIVKGEKGNPGEVQGSIDNGKVIGEVYKNTNFGIYGKLTDVSLIEGGKTLEVMPRDEVKLGKATIICTLDNNKREEHEIEIERLYTSTNRNNKNMIIKVTDERLLEKTGGIIQGMSGSPILQDGKFVGAVTHVMVNNPEKGYGIFADTMLKQMKEVEKN